MTLMKVPLINWTLILKTEKILHPQMIHHKYKGEVHHLIKKKKQLWLVHDVAIIL